MLIVHIGVYPDFKILGMSFSLPSYLIIELKAASKLKRSLFSWVKDFNKITIIIDTNYSMLFIG